MTLSNPKQYEMHQGWYRPDGAAWSTVGEQVAALKAAGAYKRPTKKRRGQS